MLSVFLWVVCGFTYCPYFLCICMIPNGSPMDCPVLELETKKYIRKLFRKVEVKDMYRFEFVLSDGSHVAVMADSRVEAAKKVREMLNND